MGGTAYDTLDILADTQYPISHTTPLMATTHAGSVTARRAILVPYKSVAAPALPKTLPSERQDAQTLLDVVAAIATNEDRREVEKCKLAWYATPVCSCQIHGIRQLARFLLLPC